MQPPCCPSGPTPVAPPEDYQEQGEEILVEALPCYQSGEPTSQAAVLVLSDIFGWRSGRTRQICDKIASQGFLVILPNFFHDDGWDHNKPLTGWSCPWYFFKHLMWYGWYKHDPEKSRYSCSCLPVSSNVGTTLRHLVSHCGADSSRTLAVLGFCWGGWLALRACGISGVSCGVAVHPTMNMETFHGGDLGDAYKKIRVPVMCLSAGDDPVDAKPGGPLDEALKSKPFGQACVLREFPEMRHGWVPRGSDDDPAVQRDRAMALDAAVSFLRRHTLETPTVE
mmetsp:Transcript_75474/g.196782  ORF Transcript_75474/g.196782 Transcript_75474/m.196782 type:complete len:281 (-) Transcript_75474:141-983(-)